MFEKYGLARLSSTHLPKKIREIGSGNLITSYLSAAATPKVRSNDNSGDFSVATPYKESCLENCFRF